MAKDDPVFHRPLRGWGRGGGPGHRGDGRALRKLAGAAPVFAGGRLEADLLCQRSGDGCPEGGVCRAAGRGPGPGRAVAALAPGPARRWTTPPGGTPVSPAARGSYRVLEDSGMDLPGPRKADPPVHLRRILVYSSANAAGAASARARKLATAAGDLDRLVRTAGTGFTPPLTPSPPAPQRSPQSAASRRTCAPRSAARHRQTSPVMALRPGRHRCRGRRRWLVCPADQPGS